MRENLPQLGLSEGDVAEFISLFTEEMIQQRGPNFYSLNNLFAAFDIAPEAIIYGMTEFERKIRESLINGVRAMDVDQEIRQYMAWAIRGALEKLFTDINNTRTGDGVPDFESPEMMSHIGNTVGIMI
jgi:hypothetical protein